MTGYYGRIQIVEIHYSKRFDKCLAVTQENGESHVSLIPASELVNMTKLPGEPENLSDVFLDLLIYNFKTLPEVEFKYASNQKNLVYLKNRKDNSTVAIIEVGEVIRIISYCELDLTPVKEFLTTYAPVEYLKSVSNTVNKDEEKEEIENEELEVGDIVEDPLEVPEDPSLGSVDELIMEAETQPDILPVEVSQIEELGVDEYLQGR